MPRFAFAFVTGVLSLAAASADAQTFRGRLDASDGTLESGEYRDLHRIAVRQGQHVRASLTSTDFDPYVLLRGAASDEDDDSGEGLNALVTAQATESGELRISVTSARAGETGAYTLVVTVQDRPFADDGADATQATPSGTDGRTVFSGELAAGGATLRSGEFTRVHTAQVRPGQHVRIEMASPAFDTYLIVSGALTAQNDDIAPGRTMSRIDGVAGGDGQIRIVATSARVGETGTYLVVVRAQDTPFPPDDDTAPAPDLAAADTDETAPVTGLRQPAESHQTTLDGVPHTVYGFVGGGPSATFTLPVRRGDVVYTYVDVDTDPPVVSLGMVDADALDRVQTGGAAAAMQNALGGGGNPRLTGPVTAAATGYVDALLMPSTEGGRLPETVRFLVRRAGGADPAFPLFLAADGIARARMLLQDGSRPWADAAYRIDADRYLLPMLIDGFGGCEIQSAPSTRLLCIGPFWEHAAIATREFDRMAGAMNRALRGQSVAEPLSGTVVRQSVVDVPGGYRYALSLNRGDGGVYNVSFLGVRR